MGWVRGAAVALLVLGGSGAVGVAPVGADEIVTRSCTAAGVTWQATVNVVVSGVGPVVTVTGMTRTENGVTVDATNLEWEWRHDEWIPPWDPGDARRVEWGDVPAWTGNKGPRQPQPAGSTGWWGMEPMTIFLSPRMVSPDGGCSIYLAPFANINGSQAWPKVAVLGDSLTGQLFDPPDSDGTVQGMVEGVLNDDGILAEVEGQGGRRWVRDPAGWSGDASALGRANTDLLDEFRGLAEHDPDGVVVALGANDAFGIALQPVATRPAYRTDIQNKVMAVFDEMWSATDCFVVVTAPEHPNFYLGQAYADEAVGINDLARWFAATLPNEIKVVDFAAVAKLHQDEFYDGTPETWFVDRDFTTPVHDPENLHLNALGRAAYTQHIRQAANLCA